MDADGGFTVYLEVPAALGEATGPALQDVKLVFKFLVRVDAVGHGTCAADARHGHCLHIRIVCADHDRDDRGGVLVPERAGDAVWVVARGVHTICHDHQQPGDAIGNLSATRNEATAHNF